MKSFFENLKEFWADFRMDKIGLVGLGILAFSFIVVILEPVISPYPEASTKWNNIFYWQNLPAHAPPEWTNLFTAQKKTTTATIKKSDVSTFTKDGREGKKYTFNYTYTADIGPNDLSFEGDAVGDNEVLIELVRPDGLVVPLYNKLSNTKVFRVTVNNDCRDSASNWLRNANLEVPSNINKYGKRVTPAEFVFLVGRSGMLKELPAYKGDYRIQVSVLPATAESKFENARVTVVGKVHGILGTDGSKHDIMSGIIAGLKWALFIGLTVAIASVFVGVAYGTISAYFGGKVGTVMQLVYELFVNIPFLPLLIVISAVFTLNIWWLIFALIFFGWTGPVITVRSVALQIKEETFVEAARALGASHFRIIFKHMFPILIPFSFGLMAAAVPGAILSEATLALLGLGDPTIVSWGKILNGAGIGAASNGLWWEVIPPGLCISMIGAAFAFIGFSMDKILQPKLRTR